MMVFATIAPSLRGLRPDSDERSPHSATVALFRVCEVIGNVADVVHGLVVPAPR